MKKSNLITLLLTTITTFFLMTGLTFAQGDGHSLDAADGSPTDAVYVDNIGNVGIGTTTPESDLYVKGASDGTVTIEAPGIARWATLALQNDDQQWQVRTTGYDRFAIQDGTGSIGEAFVILPNSGNVGIGTTNPSAKLEISGNTLINGFRPVTISPSGFVKIKGDTGGWNDGFLFGGSSGTDLGGFGAYGGADSLYYYYIGPSYTSPYMVLKNGNIGIGTSSPDTQLHVKGPYDGGIRIEAPGSSRWAILYLENDAQTWRVETSGYDNFAIRDETGSLGEAFVILPTSGNVGIGTSSPQSKLAVNGKITAEEVEVITNVAAAEFKVKDTAWSDFVFDNNYNLPSLDTVETFIKENKHLPDIPSAKVVDENGLSMAEMMKKQMQKIEELTLYVIEQNKEIQELKEELAELKK